MTSIDLVTKVQLGDQFNIQKCTVTGCELSTYSMNMSAMMFMPRNIQMSQKRYMTARKGRDIREIPGKKTKLQQNRFKN